MVSESTKEITKYIEKMSSDLDIIYFMELNKLKIKLTRPPEDIC